MENFLDERNAAYDKLAKSFLSRKAILAHILKNVVEEFPLRTSNISTLRGILLLPLTLERS